MGTCLGVKDWTQSLLLALQVHFLVTAPNGEPVLDRGARKLELSKTGVPHTFALYHLECFA